MNNRRRQKIRALNMMIRSKSNGKIGYNQLVDFAQSLMDAITEAMHQASASLVSLGESCRSSAHRSLSSSSKLTFQLKKKSAAKIFPVILVIIASAVDAAGSTLKLSAGKVEVLRHGHLGSRLCLIRKESPNRRKIPNQRKYPSLRTSPIWPKLF